MKIRFAHQEDAENLTEQNIALAKESEHIILDYATTLAGVKAVLLDKRNGFYLVAEENEIIIGQIMITYEWSDWRNQAIWWVQSVYVKEAWRGQGVFTKLLNFVKREAHRQGVVCLKLYAHSNNKSARQVYEKTGWYLAPYVVYHLLLKEPDTL